VDTDEALQQLRDEVNRLDKAIALLESLGLEPQEPKARPRSERGRKGMSDGERREVSERMKRYWALRRAEKRLKNTYDGHVVT
jgi:hypothetical protein